MALSSSYKIENSLGLLSREHRRRYAEVISVITKYGLDELFASKSFKKIPLLNRFRKQDPDILELSRWVRIRLAIEELGGAYVKVGQILSNRPDMLPTELLQELEKLQNNVPPFPTEDAVKIITSELNLPLRDIFLMFDDEPLASASIAQVHRAVLLDTTSVVIKVQRPGLEEKFKIDMDIMTYLSQYLVFFDSFKAQFKRSNPIKELRYELEKELDFLNEASNIRTFAKNFEGDNRIYVPEVYSSYTTSKVLTMEYIDGIKVTDTSALSHANFDNEMIADNLVDVGLTQMFEHRFFHGDPHPGNILILEDQRICFLDFGLMGRITSRQRQIIIELVIAFANNDAKKLTRIVSRLIPRDTNVDPDVLEIEIAELLDQYFDKSLEEINIGETLSTILSLIFTYDLVLPSNIYLLIKSLSSYEGIGRRLYPQFELAPHAQSFSQKIMKEMLSPKKIAKDVYFSTAEAASLLKEFPGEARNLIHLLQSGKFTVSARVIGLEDTIDYAFNKVDRTVNRLSVTIILAAMILGSALVLQGYDPSTGASFPITASIGFGLSTLIAAFLIISMIRRGKI